MREAGMAKDFVSFDASEAVAVFKDGSVSLVEYAEAIADRAATHADLNPLQSFAPEFLVRTAGQTFEANPDTRLSGLPLVVKNNINTTAYPTSGGTQALLEHTPAADAGVVTTIAENGSFVGAKAGMHELAFGITSNNSVTGAILNPHDNTLIPGGSSGGTAAEIASGTFPAGLGTDTGGSCRIPAALCGIIGFRPTTGHLRATVSCQFRISVILSARWHAACTILSS